MARYASVSRGLLVFTNPSCASDCASSDFASSDFATITSCTTVCGCGRAHVGSDNALTSVQVKEDTIRLLIKLRIVLHSTGSFRLNLGLIYQNHSTYYY